MEQKTCYYCGTKYPLEDECCPLCGQTELEEEALDEMPVELTVEDPAEQTPIKSAKGKARAAKRSNVISTIICILLAMAVVAGALFILNSLGILSFEEKPADESSLTLPVETDRPLEVPCIGIDLAPGSAAFNEIGTSITLAVTVEPSDCTEEIVFESSNESVATVSADGKVTAVGNGAAEITVTCGEYAKSMEVFCQIEEVPEETDTPDNTDEPVTELSLSTEDFSLFEAGETAKIVVNGLQDGETVHWSSSDETVAAVDEGKVTAVGGGTATISATVGDTTLKCIVRCKFEGTAPVQPTTPDETTDDGAPFLSHEDVTLTQGETFHIRLVQGESRVQGVQWSSTDNSVCDVALDGTVTCNGSGIAKVIGTYNGVQYSCIVRCS